MELVPFSTEHFSELASWFVSEREAVQWGGPAVRYPLDGSQMQAMLDEACADPPTRLCWMAQQEGELVGHAQLAFDWRNGTALLGRVAVAPPARGRRLAAPMLARVLDTAFGTPEIERVELNVYAWNTPAIRTYEGLGFLTEGVRRSSVRVGDERWDTVMMAVLRCDRPSLSLTS